MAVRPSSVTDRSWSGVVAAPTLLERSVYVLARVQNWALFCPLKLVSTGRAVVVGPVAEVAAGAEVPGDASFFPLPLPQPVSATSAGGPAASALVHSKHAPLLPPGLPGGSDTGGRSLTPAVPRSRRLPDRGSERLHALRSGLA